MVAEETLRGSMRVLLIGGCGFIGSHLVDQLLAGGHKVRVLDQRSERYRGPLNGVDYVIGSFTDRITLFEALTGIEAVVHLASTTVPGTANLDPKKDVKDNLIGTIQLVETMLEMGITRVLFLSSGGTVYGPSNATAIPEDHSLLPINSYGIVKVAIERYLDMFARTCGLKPVVIRASKSIWSPAGSPRRAGRDFNRPETPQGRWPHRNMGRRYSGAGLFLRGRLGRAVCGRGVLRNHGRVQCRERPRDVAERAHSDYLPRNRARNGTDVQRRPEHRRAAIAPRCFSCKCNIRMAGKRAAGRWHIQKLEMAARTRLSECPTSASMRLG